MRNGKVWPRGEVTEGSKGRLSVHGRSTTEKARAPKSSVMRLLSLRLNPNPPCIFAGDENAPSLRRAATGRGLDLGAALPSLAKSHDKCPAVPRSRDFKPSSVSHDLQRVLQYILFYEYIRASLLTDRCIVDISTVARSQLDLRDLSEGETALMSGCEVSRAVASIIAAFSSGVDVLQKLRDKNKKSKIWRKPAENKDEAQLLYSLKQGQFDIQNEYAAGIQGFGQQFATGDLHTQSILNRTLLKLNSGLVDMISSFLSSNKKSPNLDFKSLTHISDASRAEALYSLGELRWRLSQQALLRARQPLVDQARRNGSGNRKPPTRNKPIAKTASGNGGSKIARVPIKDSNHTQLAIVRRPKNRGNRSSSSMSSNTSSLSGASKASTTSTALTTPDLTPASLPITRPVGYPEVMSPQCQSQEDWPGTHRSYLNSALASPVIDTQQQFLTPNGQQLPLRRRQSKLTPSVYTFKSDSTKIGEIPMQKWVTPFDFDAMERTNAWAEAEGWPANQYVRQGGKRAKPRLFQRIFTRSTANGT